MGLVDAVKQHETHAGSIIMVDANKWKRFPDGFTSGDLEILRGDLSRVLYDRDAFFTGPDAARMPQYNFQLKLFWSQKGLLVSEVKQH